MSNILYYNIISYRINHIPCINTFSVAFIFKMMLFWEGLFKGTMISTSKLQGTVEQNLRGCGLVMSTFLQADAIVDTMCTFGREDN